MQMSLESWLAALLVVTTVYLGCAYISLGLLNTAQIAIFPNLPNQVSLLYLPHGVRVLAAWLYGWRSIPLVLPGIMVTFLIHADGRSLELVLIASFVASCSAPLAFYLLNLAGHPARRVEFTHREWRLVIIAALLASLIHTVLPGWLWGVTGTGTLVLIVGNVLGSVALMVGLMFLFRWMRCKGW